MVNRLTRTIGFAILIVAAGWGRAQDQAESGAPLRTVAIVTAEIESLDADYKTLLLEEQGIVAGLKASAQNSMTNLMAMAGYDPELAEKIRKLKELDAQVRALKEDVRKAAAASPVLKEQHARMARERQRLMELQTVKMEKVARRKALLDERQALATTAAAGEK